MNILRNFRQRAANWILKESPQGMLLNSPEFAAFIANQNTSPRMGTRQLLQAYNTMPWLRAVVNKVSNSIASTTWQLYVATEKPKKGDAGRPKALRRRGIARSLDHIHRMKQYKALRKEDSLREIETHPVLDLLDHGNTAFPGFIAMQLTQQHLDLVGESAWMLDLKAAGIPSDFWPIPPNWITELPRKERPTYLVTAPSGSREVPVEEMIRFYLPDPSSPYTRGSGIGHALGDELETDEYAAKTLKAWFYNRARPDVLISAEGLRLEEIKRLEDHWLGKLKGAQNVGRPHFISRKLDVNVLSQTFQEMQLSQLRKDERDAIINVYGVPPELFGILQDSNRATIDAAGYLYARWVLMPRLEFLRIMMQLHLVERYDERLILDYVSPVMDDSEYELKVMTVQPAIPTVDEWREKMGLAPSEDTKVGQGNVAPVNMEWIPSLDELTTPEPPAGFDENGKPLMPGAKPGPGAEPEEDDE